MRSSFSKIVNIVCVLAIVGSFLSFLAITVNNTTEVFASTMTFYPDAHPETDSVDGHVYYLSGQDTWSAVRGYATGTVNDTDAFAKAGIYTGVTTNYWHSFYRAPLCFDTSSLPDNATISSATVSLYGADKYDQISCSPTLNVYSWTGGSSTSISAGDYDGLGTTAYCDTAVTYAGFDTSGYNDFTLNSTGLATVSKTGVSYFGVREAAHDAANSEPSWSGSYDLSMFLWMSADAPGTSQDPKLVVTYTIVPEVPTSLTATEYSDTRIDLTWVLGTYSDNTMVRRKTGSYPTSTSDGTQVYFSTGTSTSDTSLSAGTTYYYSAWAYNSTDSLYSATYATAYATTLDNPSVTTVAATLITISSARLNLTVSDDGGDDCYVRFQYGPDTGYGTDTSWVGPYSTSETYYYDLSGLSLGQHVHFRAQIYNSVNGSGSPVSGSDQDFTTSSNLAKPEDLSSNPVSSTEISLTWIKGDGAQYTIVRYSKNSFPADYDSGTLAYNGVMSSCSVTGLDPGCTYFFRAWSYTPDAYSDVEPSSGTNTADAGTDTDTLVDAALEYTTDDYYIGCYLYNSTRSAGSYIVDYVGSTTTAELEDTITSQTTGDSYYIYIRSETIATTDAGSPDPEAPGSVTTPDLWTQEPDASGLSNLPFYPLFNSVADTMEMDQGDFWMMISIIVIIAIGALTYVIVRDMVTTIGVVGVSIAVGAISGPVPLWMLFAFLLIGGPYIYAKVRG